MLIENYVLCPNHYLTAPIWSWDAILSMTKVELGLISDIDMYLCFEKGMRDGVSYISKNTVKTDNKYLTSYDPKNSTKCITYLDKKNLYGYAMSKPFPSGVFKWLDPAKFNLNKYGNDSWQWEVVF